LHRQKSPEKVLLKEYASFCICIQNELTLHVFFTNEMKTFIVVVFFAFSTPLTAGNRLSSTALPLLPVLTIGAPDSTTLIIPNVFTPNGDGVNDVFHVSGVKLRSMDCILYDRWGIKLWELKSPLESWDGHTLTGLTCVTGVYYYVLKATGMDGTTYSRSGALELIR
jgi:gliding motility-associated-like protein